MCRWSRAAAAPDLVFLRNYLPAAPLIGGAHCRPRETRLPTTTQGPQEDRSGHGHGRGLCRMGRWGPRLRRGEGDTTCLKTGLPVDVQRTSSLSPRCAALLWKLLRAVGIRLNRPSS